MAKYSRRRKSSRRRRSKPARKRRSLLGRGSDDKLNEQHLKSLYDSMKSDENLHNTFIGVCQELDVSVFNSVLPGKEEKEEKGVKVLDEKGIDGLLGKCYNNNNKALIKKLGELAEKNPAVMGHMKTIIKNTVVTGGHRGGAVPRRLQTRADLLFASGVVCVIGGLMACVSTHFVPLGTAGLIVGGGAIIVSCTLPGLYRVTESLFSAVRSRIGINDPLL